MSWHTAVAGLTALVAHDALHTSGSSLTDLTPNGRTLALGGQALAAVRSGTTGAYYYAIVGGGAAMAYASALTLPTNGCTIFALLRLRGQALLVHGNPSVAGNYYLALQPNIGTEPAYAYSNSSSANLPVGVRGRVVSVALTFTGGQGQYFLDGLWRGGAVTLTSQPTVSWGLTYPSGWGLNSDLLCLGIFSGQATEAQLQALEAAARADLVAPNPVDLVLDETFATELPASFGPLLSQSGTGTVTYNAAQQAVDIASATSGFSLWQCPGEFLPRGEFAADIQLLSDQSGANNTKHTGLWLQSVAKGNSQGLRCWIYQESVGMTFYGPAFALHTELGGRALQNKAFVAGTRRRFKVKADLDPDGKKCELAFYLDDDLMMMANTDLVSALNLGVFVYQCTVRVHAVTQTRATDLDQTVGAAGLPTVLGMHRPYTPPGAVPRRSG